LITAQAYSQINQTNKAQGAMAKVLQIADRAMADPNADLNTMISAIQAYDQSKLVDKRQTALFKAVDIAERLIANPQLDGNSLRAAAQAYSFVNRLDKMELVLGRLTQVEPTNAEAWYDYAAIQTAAGKPAQALQSLSVALQLSDSRRRQNPGAADLRAVANSDPRFGNLRASPEFQKILSGK